MRLMRVVLAFALALVTAPAWAAPLEAYGKLPSVEAVALSPNGQQIALIVTNGEQRVIVVKDIATDAFVLRAGAGDANVRGLRWVGDQHLLFVTAVVASPMEVMTSKRDWMMPVGIDVAKRKVVPLMRGVERSMNIVLDVPEVRTYRGEQVAFAKGISFGEGGRGKVSLFRIDMDRGDTTLVDPGLDTTRDWIVGLDGEVVGQELYDPKSGRWALRLKDGAGWRDIEKATALTDRPYALGLGRDGKSVVYGSVDGGSVSLHEARLDGGASAEAKPLRNDLSPLTDPLDGRFIGQHAFVGDEHRYEFFDPNDARAWKAVQDAFPGALVSLRSWSLDRKRIVARVDSPVDGPAFALVDLGTRKATWLGGEYEGIKAADVAQKTAIRFKARDGLALTGYVTRPRDAGAKRLPLVVVPHDLDEGRDGPGYDWFAQAVASRGYTVLQVNYRGSGGLGGDLLTAGYGQWGRMMQSDLADGVKHLAGEGLIDSQKVCIVGDGYGGYAALAGVTLEQGIYRCAVSVAGIADLRKLVAYTRLRGGVGYQRLWLRMIGAEDPNDAALATYSPAAHAAQASVPILLIHGKDDVVVPVEQSQIMADALRKAGKPVELIVQKGGDHGLTLGQTRLEMLTSTMAFLEKHNPPN